MARSIALIALLLAQGCGVVASLAPAPFADGSPLRPVGADGGALGGERDASAPPPPGSEAGPSTDGGDASPGAPDGGPGSGDAGLVDAGLVDAGLVDAGAIDAGLLDAGAVDAGLDGGPAAVCGNGAVEPGEACDDGNLDDGDGCSLACSLWWDTSLDVRARFTLTSPVGEAVEGVPVSLSFPRAWLPEGAADGDVCAVASDHRTVLPLEVERLVVDETIFVWTRLDALPPGESEVFLYLGDASLCPGAPADVWSSSYRAVWHLDGAADSVGDRAVVPVGNDVALVSGGARSTAAEISPSSWLEREPIGDLWITGDLTLEAWVRIDQPGAAGDFENTIFQAAGGGEPQAYFLNVENDGRLRAYWERDLGFGAVGVLDVESDVSFSLQLGGWHHVAMVRDSAAGRLKFYVDGQQLGAEWEYVGNPNGLARTTSFLYLGGNFSTTSRALDGGLDEVRIADTTHSDDWIAVSYASTAGTLVTSSVRETP